MEKPKKRRARYAFEQSMMDCGMCMGPLNCEAKTERACYNCGFFFSEYVRRIMLLKTKGLTEGPDGLLHLNIAKEEKRW